MVIETTENKVKLITEIGTNWKKLTGKTIDSNEFDYLIDQPEEQLQYLITAINDRLVMLATLEALEEVLHRMTDRTATWDGNGTEKGE
jgi:flagellar hook assembly protein FlgD